LPESGHVFDLCFGCGHANEHSLKLAFETDPRTHEVRCRTRLSARYTGARGFMHGGIVATLLDEAMSQVNHALGDRAPTSRLNVEYLEPVPLDADIVIEAKRLRRQGRTIENAALIRFPGGRALARGHGTFVTVGDDWPKGPPNPRPPTS
jgi:uncharacterized protein (TIGR00369 family)